MKENYFSQIRLFEYKKFQINEDSVLVKESSLLSTNIYNVYYEDIPNDRREVTQSHEYIFWIAIGLICLDIFLVIVSIIDGSKINSYFSYAAVVLIIVWAVSRRTYIVYSAGYGLAFFKAKRRKNELEKFIKLLFAKRDEYLLAKYGTPNNEFSLIDELERIAFLYERKLLKKDEYQKLKKDLLSQMESKPGPIGFMIPNKDPALQKDKSLTINEILPEICNCSACGVKLELDDSERKERKFNCPECNYFNDLTGLD